MFYQVIFQYHATTLNLSVLRNKIIYTIRIISIQCIDDNIKKNLIQLRMAVCKVNLF